MLKDIDANRAYITTPEAARRSGLTRIYLARLLREGRLEGFQLAREWFIYIDSLERFLATPRKSGPKGPFKKTKRQSSETTSTKNESNNA